MILKYEIKLENIDALDSTSKAKKYDTYTYFDDSYKRIIKRWIDNPKEVNEIKNNQSAIDYDMAYFDSDDTWLLRIDAKFKNSNDKDHVYYFGRCASIYLLNDNGITIERL